MKKVPKEIQNWIAINGTKDAYEVKYFQSLSELRRVLANSTGEWSYFKIHYEYKGQK